MSEPETCLKGHSPSGDGWTVAAGRASRFLSLAYLGFVALCLTAPLVQTLYPVLGTFVPPVEERRGPSPFPSLRLLSGTNSDFSARLNQWFDDRLGFRDLFIRSKNQIDYTLFYTSKKVYVGRDGWLFYRPAKHPVSDLNTTELAQLEDSFMILARRLHDKGVQLIVIGYPDKSTIYPEMVAPSMPLMPEGGNYDQLRLFLAAQSELTFIDAEEIMKREKLNTLERLYYKTDMHATQIADIPIVGKIIARIAKEEGQPNIRWDEKFTLMHAPWSNGAEARFSALLFPPTEEVPYFADAYTIGQKEPDGFWFLPDPLVFERADNGIGRPFDWQFRSLPELCPQRLPGMVLFGNSFSDFYWSLGLHRYFCFIRRAREPISRLKAFYDTMPPDTKYFVFQYYEPWMTEILSEPWFWSDARH
jgi:hypothetical protein